MPRNNNSGNNSGNGGRYNSRRWYIPSKRAKSYADERKAKVHQHGPKEGKELTDYEAGIRSGYLQAQSDHAQASTSTKRPFPRARASRKRAISRSAEAEIKFREEVNGKECDQSRT